MTVTVTLFAEEDQQVRTFLFQDTPEYMPTGDSADLAHHDVLEFLSMLGLAPHEAQHLLEQALQPPPRVVRKRFDVSAEQLAAGRNFLAE